MGFTKSLAGNWLEKHHRQCGSGFVETPMTDAMPEKHAQTCRELPLRRGGTVQDIADAVAFLASDQASYITGMCCR
ncbi:MAG: SDR family oxidoreductase [Merdibacter sp.]